MQSLLRWSIENSAPRDSAPSDATHVERMELDPGIIDVILGRPDSELMKEDMAVAADSSQSEDDRVNALDHFEMLIEQIDNANNIETLKLWEPLQSLLTSDEATMNIKVQALWIIGTAVQNNPAAQGFYLSLNPLPTLISFLVPSASSTLQIRSKAIYALSGLLKHNSPAVQALDHQDVDGWSKLRNALQDPEITVRRKTAFLLNTLLVPENPPNSQRPIGVSLGTPFSSNPYDTNVHAPNQPHAPENIHANSHASHLRNPDLTRTSKISLDAFRSYGIFDAVLSAIVNPVPFGEDGDNTDVDFDFEEKVMRLIHTYVVLCRADLSATQKDTLKKWMQDEKKKGEIEFMQRINLDPSELAAIEQVVQG